MVRFYCIMEPDRQQQVLALAQQYAAESKAAQGRLKLQEKVH